MDNNILVWQAVIFGPDDTPWEGGTFKLLLEFTEDYPNKAPSVRFLTKMFHPNIYNDGQICLGEWRRRRRWRRGGRRAAGVPAAASLASGRNRPPRPIMTSRQRHLTFLPPHHCSCQTFSKTSGVRSTTFRRF